MNEQKSSFYPFPKMARLSRECIITEKIDGTNAQVFIWDEGYRLPSTGNVQKDMARGTVFAGPAPTDVPWLWSWSRENGALRIAAGSRTKWITEHDDNFAFAKWVIAHAEQLATLGHGRHFGEWWGNGIQRGYGLPKDVRRFSLFNTQRWCLPGQQPREGQSYLPECVSLVPEMWRGQFNIEAVERHLQLLKDYGSQAVPGFMNPEGVVVFHTAANFAFKKTIENDEQPKSKVK